MGHKQSKGGGMPYQPRPNYGPNPSRPSYPPPNDYGADRGYPNYDQYAPTPPMGRDGPYGPPPTRPQVCLAHIPPTAARVLLRR